MNRTVKKVLTLVCAAALLVCCMPLTVLTVSADSIHRLKAPTVSGLELGRDYLSSLVNGDALVEIYDAMVNGAYTLEETVYHKEYKDVRAGVDVLPLVWSAYCNDHPEQFWVKGYWYGYYGEEENGLLASVYLKYEDDFSTADAVNDAIDEINDAADEALEEAGITDSMSDYEKAIRLHDLVDEWVVYTVGVPHLRNIYGSMINGEAVCEGYCEMYNYLLTLSGVWAYRVTGRSMDQDHAWSMVRMDGNYYHVDPTWDDTTGSTKFHNYFGLTDEAIGEDHTIGMPYPIPACTATDCSFFTVNKMPDIHVEPTAKDVETLIEVFKTSECAHVHVLGDDPTNLVDWWLYNSGTADDPYYDNAFYIGQRVMKNRAGFSFSAIAQGRECYLYLRGERKNFQEKPGVPVIKTQTKNSVTLKYTMWYEYSIDGVNWTQDPAFTKLEPGTTYTFYQRMMERENYYASPVSDPLTVTLPGGAAPKPDAPTVESQTEDSVTLRYTEGYEYSMDGVNWTEDPTFEGLKPMNTYSFYQRVMKKGDISESPASDALQVTMPRGTVVAKKGDLTGDGAVDADDLTVLARHVAKLDILTDATVLANADVTGNGEVDADDLTKLARVVAKLDTLE